MTLVFAASEVGSCRALAPVARHCRNKGLAVTMLARGRMPEEAAAAGLACAPCGDTEREIDAFLDLHAPRLVIFSSNIRDPLPLALARRAGQRGLCTLHVLDYWSGYAQRLRLDGLPEFLPDAYAVPDELARLGALEEGIPDAIIVVAGQPAFADLMDMTLPSPSQRRRLCRAAGFDADRPLLLFVSEPVALDQGDDPSGPGYRGYTERSALGAVFAALQPLAETLQLAVLPHPREDAAALERWLEAHRGSLAARLLRLPAGRDALPLAVGVMGMSSTLLHEAWLTGLPVASIQPGLRLPSLANMKGRDEVLFLDMPNGQGQPLRAWAQSLSTSRQALPRPEAARHAAAAAALHGLALGLLDGPAHASRCRRTP